LQGETVAAIPFDDAFACLQGDLSVYKSTTAQTNDGNAWNRPIYCVQGGLNGIDNSGQRCYLSGVTEDECVIGSGVSTIQSGSSPITVINGVTITRINSTWDDNKGACKIMTEPDPSAAITSAVCGTITRATLPETTPIVATTFNVTAPDFGTLGATTSGLVATWSTTDNACVLSGTYKVPDGTVNPPTGDIFDAASCNVTRIRQGGTQELAATGVWVAEGASLIAATDDKPATAANSSGSARCQIALNSNASLSATCGSIDLVRAFKVATGSASEVTAEWK
jgi:hypothetical protein